MEEFEIIVFFVERFSKDDIGGVKSYLRRIIHNFTEKGIKTKIVTLKTKIHPLEEETINGIDVVRLDCGDFLDRVDEFSKVASEKREEVIVIGNLISHASSSWSQRMGESRSCSRGRAASRSPPTAWAGRLPGLLEARLGNQTAC